MKKTSLITGILVALSLAFVPACKKDKKKTDEAPATGDPAGMGKPADTPTTDPAAPPTGSDPAAGGAAGATDPAAGGAAGSDPEAAGGAAGSDPAAGGAADEAKKDDPAAAGAAGDEMKKDEEKK